MAEITFEVSCRQIEAIRERVWQAQKRADHASALVDLHRLLGHPCARHQVPLDEVWDDIYQQHKVLGDYDAAIDAKRRAVTAGYTSVPDPDADIAECHLLAGRRVDADRLFSELAARDADDVWLYNAAGYTYGGAGDPATAAGWLRQGIEVALRTGDADRVVYQLFDGLAAAEEELGQKRDEALAARVEAFTESWKPPPVALGGPGEATDVDDDRSCAYCGYDPQRSWTQEDERRRRQRRRTLAEEMPDALARLEAIPSFEPEPPPTRLEGAVSLNVAWFPAPDWAQAIARWPDLLDGLPVEHLDYSHRIEARVKQIARAAPGQRMHVAPMTVDGLVSYCEANGDDPGTAQGRSAYAAELGRQHRTLRWPPGRNELCWCASGRKYKTCCGPFPSQQD